MLQADSDRSSRFVLYVEGPRDRDILKAWARRLLPSLAGDLSRASVILGGRRPDRAFEHFGDLGGTAEGWRGLCILDRDDCAQAEPARPGEPGLEFFTWSRRHIESYLLVPAAIRRVARLPDDDARVDRALREHLPVDGDERGFREVDAKWLLGPKGPLPRALGRPVPLGRIARVTREAELHPDVAELFQRLRQGIAPRALVV